MSLEDNQELNNGALLLGAGRTLGMTDEETLAMKKATMRREQRARRAQREEREGNRASAEEFLAEDDRRFQSKGRNRRSDQKIERVRVTDDYPDPFGSYSEPVYNEDGNLIETRIAEEDFQTYDSEEIERLKVKGTEIDPETGFPVKIEDPGLDQERGMWVTLNRGTPQEMRLWREGRKVAQTGTKAAASRADRPAGSRLFKEKKTAEKYRQSDLAKGSQRDIRIAPDQVSEQDRIQAEKARRDSEKRAIREMIVSDASLTNPEMAEYRQYLAEAEAQEIARTQFGLRGPGGFADESIGRIADIQMLGTAGPVGHGNSDQFQISQRDDVNNFGIASPHTRSGEVVGYYGDVDGEMVQLGEINTPGTANALNVPEFSSGQEWVVQNRPNYASPGGITFGIPQVDVSGTLESFGERMRSSGLDAAALPTPRSLPEFEAAVESLLARGRSQGQTFYRRNDTGDGATVVENPGIDDVLYKLGYTADEKSELANALLQLETSRTRNVNQDFKEDYALRMPHQFGDTQVTMGWEPEKSPARLDKVGRGEKVGRGKKRQGVGAALRAIDPDSDKGIRAELDRRGELFTEGVDAKGRPVRVMLPNAANAIASADEGRTEAKKPFIAAPRGEKPERARFIRGKDRGKSEAELVEQYGGSQGTIAAEIQRRYEEDAGIRALPPASDPAFARLVAADEAGRGEAARSMYLSEQRELAELSRLVREGKLSVPSEASFGGQKPFMTTRRGVQTAYPFQGVQRSAQIAEDATPKSTSTWMGQSRAGRRINPWSDSRDVPIQRIEEVPVPASIAPDPGVRTGSSPMPMADAGGGMGGGMLPPGRTAPGYAENPNKGPQQGPRMRTEPRNSQQRRDRTDNFFTRMGADPRTKRGRNILYGAGGGTAALAGILGLANIEREEEEQF